MNIGEARQVCHDVIDEFYKIRRLNPGERLTSLSVTPRVDQHLSVGLSKSHGNQFRIELRIRRHDGFAARYARGVKEKYKDAVSVSRLVRVEIPSKYQAQNSSVTANTFFTSRSRPFGLGASIAHKDAFAGSAGLFVKFGNGDVGVLSNSHVLAVSGRAKMGDPIYQPGRPDIKSVVEGNRIGHLVDFISLSATGTQELDAAVAKLDLDILGAVGTNIIPANLTGCGDCGRQIAGVGLPENLGPQATVCKVGRTTGWTRGVVTALSVDNLPVFSPQLNRNIRFDNVFEVTWESTTSPFSGAGDSGSVVYDPATMNAVGLVFAGGIREIDGKQVGASYICSLNSALAAFGVQIC